MWVLRWPIVLVLLGYVVLCVAAAAGIAADRLGLAIDSDVWAAFVANAQGATWIDTALWAGAGAFLFIAAIRLIRRTQGFWAWLLGFICFGARWAVAVQGPDNFIADVAAVRTMEDAQRTALAVADNYPLLAVLLLFLAGLLILIVDAADRRWANRG